jgi:prepilin-type N-terminal cleavage/methylation domain-containing protein
MPKGLRQSAFTLIEVVIAATILAMSVAFTMGIVGTARGQVLRSERRWGRAHLLSQAAEFHLLAGARNRDLPDGLLPDGYHSSCELVEVLDLPEEWLEPINGWRLGEFVIRVDDPNGQPIGEVRVRKLVREEDLE